MAYKRYIKKGGKVYGPYLYESKKLDGKVVSNYVGKGSVNNFSLKKTLIYSFGFFLFCLMIISLTTNLTGNVALSIEDSYVEGETLNGMLKLSLEQGEFIPASTIVLINNSGEISEYLLSDLISESSETGTFFLESVDVSGTGLGFGVGDLSYPEVFFSLEIFGEENETSVSEISKTEGETTEIISETSSTETATESSATEIVNETSESVETESFNETIESSSESESSGEIIESSELPSEESEIVEESSSEETSESEVVQESETSSENTEIESLTESTETTSEESSSESSGETSSDSSDSSSDSSSESSSSESSSDSSDSGSDSSSSDSGGDSSESSSDAGITGQIIGAFLNFFSLTGNAIVDEVELSVSYNETVRYDLEEGQTAEIKSGSVYTSERELEDTDVVLIQSEGYVEITTFYYLGDEKTYEINLTDLGLTAQEGLLSVSLVYNGTEILSEDEFVSVLDNVSVEDVLINATLNETLLPLNQSNVTFVNATNISMRINTTQFSVVINRPVKWKKEVEVNKSQTVENISIQIPKEATNISVYKIVKEEKETLIANDTIVVNKSFSEGGLSSGESSSEEVSTNETISESNETEIVNETSEEIVSESKIDITGNVILGEVSLEIDVGSEKSSIASWFRNMFGALTGRVIDIEENETAKEIIVESNESEEDVEIEVEYETPGPTSTEEVLNGDKKVVVSSEIHYENVLAYTIMDGGASKNYNIYWEENNTFLPIYYQEDGYGDKYLEWVIPHLSNQTFVIYVVNESNFSVGGYDNTYWNSTNSAVMINDTEFGYTKLLLHFDGTDDSTDDSGFIDSSGQRHSVIQTGNAKFENTEKTFGGTSVYFDGTDDGVVADNSADWDFGSGDFTIDFWVNVPAHDGTWRLMGSYGYGWGADKYQWIIGLDSSNRTQFNFDGVTGIVDSGALAEGEWVHLAFVRDGSSFMGFKNGQLVGSQTSSAAGETPDLGLWNLSLGILNYNNNYDFTGYIDEFRITKGKALWSSNFTPPSRESGNGTYTSEIFDATTSASWENLSYSSNIVNGNDDYTEILLHFDGIDDSISDYDFYDSAGSGLAVTREGNVNLTNDYSKFGGSSAFFDGTGDAVHIADDPIFDLGYDDFTIDLWIRPRTAVSSDGIFTTSTTGGYGSILYFYGTNALVFYGSPSVGASQFVTDNGLIVLNEWQHLAVVRKDNITSIYHNGNLAKQGSAVYTSNCIAGAYVGKFQSNTAINFDGYIDEVRFSKGIARWTGNFTPPNEGYYNSLNLLARSCDDDACADDAWVDISDEDFQNLTLSNNRYFQYKFDMESENMVYSPELYNVSFSYIADIIESPTANRFEIKNSSGSVVGVIDSSGNLFLKGTVSESQSSLVAPANSFVVNNNSGSTIMYVNSSGNLFLKGTVSESQSSLVAPANSFVIQNSSEATVAYIDSEGNLNLKGVSYESYSFS